MERGMERGDDVEVVEGLRGGGEERVEEGRGVGRESADEAEVDGDREGEGEERGGEGRDVGEWEESRPRIGEAKVAVVVVVVVVVKRRKRKRMAVVVDIFGGVRAGSSGELR
ncbi:hypothetical protein FCV25MIE_08825 [Fagus crenata]